MDLYQILIMLDILESIEIFCSVVFSFSFGAASCLGVISFFNTQVCKESEVVLPFKPLKFIKIFCLVGFLFSIIAAFIPEKKTMYLAVGSYITEQSLQSEEGQKVRKILQLELDKYLEEEKQKSVEKK